MQNVAMLVQLWQEDRARLISRLDWLFEVLEDRQTNDEDKALFEQAFLIELERYTGIEDQIAWLSVMAPSERKSDRGEEAC